MPGAEHGLIFACNVSSWSSGQHETTQCCRFHGNSLRLLGDGLAYWESCGDPDQHMWELRLKAIPSDPSMYGSCSVTLACE